MLFKKKAKTETMSSVVKDGVTKREPSEPEPENEGENNLATVNTTATEDIVYPSGLRFVLLLTATFVSMFLVALDRLIISTAIPEITDEFKSVTDIGWYGSAFLLTNCGFQLIFGKLFVVFPVKATFLIAIFIFEAGSAICGAAPNSVAFIIGRAIAGVGAAGIMSGTIVVIVFSVPLHKRPLFQGLFGVVFGVSSILGPVVGGAFTSGPTWRWCFYINLPLGAVAFAFIAVLLKVPDRDSQKLPLKKKILQLDLLGASALLPGTVALLLALQWGGLEYKWSDGRVVACLVLGILLLAAFVGVQIWKPKTAMLPPHIFKQRTMVAGSFTAAMNGSHMMIFVYFLPLWFQAIKGSSPIDSGIKLFPMLLPLVTASIIAGVVTTKIGYYMPALLVSVCLAAIGAGLLTTLQVHTEQAKWIGFQVLYGFGLGLGMQVPNLAAQTVLANKDVPIGTSLMLFTQLLGGSIFLSVGQNVFNTNLNAKLSPLPGYSPGLLLTNGATSLIQQFPVSVRPEALKQYNEALREVFRLGLILACLVIVGAVFIEWKSVKKNVIKKKNKSEEEKGAGTDEDVEKGPSEEPETDSTSHGRVGTNSGDEKGSKKDGIAPVAMNGKK
ncbi:major facilitator superfamily transporter [Podospora fimiseda]|uniref:Major facilitator superfamily transporter n=1 Tax=Podospora fimiseda TaxID=252190 RepID=A0AAN7BVJ2_9PEZI|nr:major facilitator superfamily transporter [Podospora fimiseda]